MAGVIIGLTNACLSAQKMLRRMHGQNFELQGKVADLSSSALKTIIDEMKNNQENVVKKIEEVKTKAIPPSVTKPKSFAEIVGNGEFGLVKPMKLAMKEIETEDKRKRNVIIRGLDIDSSVSPENQEESIKENAKGCLVEIRDTSKNEIPGNGLKDVVASMKILGKIGSCGKAPPVLVTMKNSFEAEHIIKHASRLSKVCMLRRVYVTPDMSKEERETQKKLVDDLKKKIEEFPEEHWVIRLGAITSKGKYSPRKRLNSKDEGKDLDRSFQY